MFKHILLPLDGSQLAEAAIPFVVELCKKLNCKITLLHVIEKDVSPEIHGQHHLTNEAEACDYLGDIADKYFNFCGSVEKHVHTEEVSQVSQSIVQHSGEFAPDLIVLCAHGVGGVRDIVAGSIAQQVIANGDVPVLLIHPENPFKGFKNILLPLDGEPEHDRVLEFAAGLARQLNSDLHLVRIVPTYSTLAGENAALGTMLPATTIAYLDVMEEEAADYLQQHLNSLCKQGIDTEAEVQRGDPAQEVVKSANRSNADMIILGTHGKSGLNAFWSGSVAPKILARTKLPVLLYPVRRK
jgi:nucleotide-binding universal stress UspA family protein